MHECKFWEQKRICTGTRERKAKTEEHGTPRLYRTTRPPLVIARILELDIRDKFFNIREVLKLDLALRRVKETTAFHGNGYFTVDKTTLTAMLSTTVTYLIVLIQSPSTSGSGGDLASNVTSNCSCSSG